MYREEFTRRWHEEQFPEREGGNQSNSWRDRFTEPTAYNNTRLPGNNIYLPTRVPLPIQHESELRRPVVRSNPAFGRNEEASFVGNQYSNFPENRGVDNLGFNGNQRHERPYDSGSFAAVPRNEPMHFYNRKAPSEPGRRPPGWEVSRTSEFSYPTQPRSMHNISSGISDVPLWMKTFDPDRELEESGNEKRDFASKVNQTSMCTFITIRVVIVCLIIWDLINDWLLATSGPVQFLGTATDFTETTCQDNFKVLNKTFMINISKVDTSMCKNTTDIWTLAAVFALLGSLLAILQVINIVMEIVKRSNPHFFQILQGHSEICFVMFFEELPQSLLFTIYLFICDCSKLRDGVNLYSLLASVCACTAITLRYASSFDSISGDNGCCNQWWRCCCCRNQDYICRIHPKECCCLCDMPCPVCCCTLQCKMCRYTPKSWCASLLKAFSCFCGCCETEDDFYGVRLVNNLSIFILWVCLAFQIVIYHSMVTINLP